MAGAVTRLPSRRFWGRSRLQTGVPMSNRYVKQLRKGSRKFRPGLETLENRWCPNASITFNGPLLIICGDASNDTITIRDDGKGDVSASLVSANANLSGQGS